MNSLVLENNRLKFENERLYSINGSLSQRITQLEINTAFIEESLGGGDGPPRLEPEEVRAYPLRGCLAERGASNRPYTSWTKISGDYRDGVGSFTANEIEVETAGFACLTEPFYGRVVTFGDSQARQSSECFGREGIDGVEITLSGYAAEDLSMVAEELLSDKLLPGDLLALYSGTMNIKRGDSADAIYRAMCNLVSKAIDTVVPGVMVVVQPIPFRRAWADHQNTGLISEWCKLNASLSQFVRSKSSPWLRMAPVPWADMNLNDAFHDDGYHLSFYGKRLYAAAALSVGMSTEQVPNITIPVQTRGTAAAGPMGDDLKKGGLSSESTSPNPNTNPPTPPVETHSDDDTVGYASSSPAEAVDRSKSGTYARAAKTKPNKPKKRPAKPTKCAPEPSDPPTQPSTQSPSGNAPQQDETAPTVLSKLDMAIERLKRVSVAESKMGPALKGVFKVQKIRGDGNCFFRALLDQLQMYGPALGIKDYMALRGLVANEVESADYIDWEFMARNAGSSVSGGGGTKEALVQKCRKDREYVDGQEIYLAAGKVLGCTIEVFSGNNWGRQVVTIQPGKWTATIGLVSGAHFVSLRPVIDDLDLD